MAVLDSDLGVLVNCFTSPHETEVCHARPSCHWGRRTVESDWR